jgi:RNA polymerase sigma-70 factor (ECF subfamily)
MGDIRATIDEVFRRETGAVLATLLRQVRDFDLAEDALQDAYVDALRTWPERGIPDRPGAWLTTAARRRAIDRLRRSAVLARKQEEILADLVVRDQDRSPDVDDPSTIADDQLKLIFTCCHPALSTDAQVALTLRSIGGLTTQEIAAAFLVSEATMAQRIVRAKRKIKDANIPYRVPPDHQLPDRVGTVLAVVYLIFNEGYAASGGTELVRVDLAEEAIRLGRLLAELMPDEPEVQGLLALMLLNHARAAARVDAAGDLVLLGDQDRSRWDHALIEEGADMCERALRAGRPGPYQVQAAISHLHCAAPSVAETDWAQIVALYTELAKVNRSPIVELNRAVAAAMLAGPDAGLEAIDRVAGVLDGYRHLHSARADLLRRLDRVDEAAAAYRRALELVDNEQERRFLERRLEELSAQRPS